ncbi:MAG: pirin-like C-terminal cupin domain-containing protein, partial [Myxococcota bacterium]|nr:pirin-like C-terminal cupin domain-containing protein [Myxococcota bacterium]
MMSPRSCIKIFPSLSTHIGPTYPAQRVFPTPYLQAFDPFLLLDIITLHPPSKHLHPIPHPYYGLERISYLIHGHKTYHHPSGEPDVQPAGSVHWLQAGTTTTLRESVSISEAHPPPFHEVQIWIQLPRAHKHRPATTKVWSGNDLPIVHPSNSRTRIRILCGALQEIQSKIQSSAESNVLHITLQNDSLTLPIPARLKAAVYVLSGHVQVESQRIDAFQIAIFGEGESLRIQGHGSLILLSGVPLKEPIARQGSLITHTKEALMQAFHNYQNDTMETKRQ